MYNGKLDSLIYCIDADNKNSLSHFNGDCAKAKLLRKAIDVIIKSRYYFSRKILLKHNSLLLIFKEELCYNKIPLLISKEDFIET